MTLLKLLLALLFVSQIFCAAGADVSCSAATCTTAGTCPNVPSIPSGLVWQNGVGTGKCAITNCPVAGTASGLTGASDIFCQSCPGTASAVPAVFANVAGSACVASTLTCGNTRSANSWINADCLACYGTSNQYAKTDKSGCQATTPIIGADVSCSAVTCTTVGTCPAAPSVPSGLVWQNGVGNGKCAIYNCPATGTASGLTGASDLFCQSCPGTAGAVPAVFANVAGSACVASTLTCGNTRSANSWINADCLACYGTSNQYAKTDKSGCQATSPIIGTDVSCSAATCTTVGTCPAAPSVPSGLVWQNGVGTGKCAIYNCPATGTASGLTGASDLFCQSCPGTPNGAVQAVFANAAGNACVAATLTCGNTRAANSWTNADCLACQGTSNQYAKSDKSGCQATSASNSTIILSSILFLISFLF
ncbi:hypothetical protein ABPG72_011147 [Tetrahymena utriculariae]